MYYRTVPTRTRGRGGGCSGRLLMAAAIAAFSLFSYFSSRQDNPVTGETQYIDITPEQEIALGLEAAPQMAAEFGGLDENAQDQALLDEIGNRIVQSSPAASSPYQFDFHLLDDDHPTLHVRRQVHAELRRAPHQRPDRFVKDKKQRFLPTLRGLQRKLDRERRFSGPGGADDQGPMGKVEQLPRRKGFGQASPGRVSSAT